MLSPKKLVELRGDIRKLSEGKDESGRLALAILVLQGALEVHARQIGELQDEVSELKKKIARLR